MMTVDELAVVLLELAQTPRQDEWIAQWRPELVDALVTVTQWALGRIPAEIVRRLPGQRQPEELGEAALLFVRRVCFAPEGTYYEIFGLTPETVTPQSLRARYRALIRLTHPDVGVKGLPANAASLVNQAYAVLSSANARWVYDAQLAAGERPSPASAPVEPPAPAEDPATAGASVERRIVAQRTRMGERMLARWVMLNARWSRQLQLVLVGAALMVPLGVLLVWNLSGTLDVDTIVARAPDTEEPLAQTAAVLSPREQEGGRADPGENDAGSRARAAAALPGTRGVAPTRQAPAMGEHTVVVRERGPAPGGIFGPDAGGPGHAGLGGEQDTGAWHDQVNAGVASGESAPDPGADHGAQQWQVDWPAARRYLQDIALAVGDEAEAESLNHYLEQMHVKGSLLQPIMDLHQRYGSLSTQYSTWSMAEGHGLFDARTMLTIRAAADGTEPVVRSFLLRAQFQATASGTRLATLDFQSLE